MYTQEEHVSTNKEYCNKHPANVLTHLPIINVFNRCDVIICGQLWSQKILTSGAMV